MADLRRRLLNPYGNEFPDDNSLKEIRLQADQARRTDATEDRHVCLRWVNGVSGEGEDEVLYTQIIHLTGGPGTYAFHSPQVKMQSKDSLRKHTFYSLGRFTRADRDRVLSLARAVSYDPRSRVNCCRVWMRDLLEAMVNAGLLQKAVFDHLDVEIPLKKRVVESQGTA